MRNKILGLQPAVQVAQSREDTAARELAEFQRRLSEQQSRLQHLLDLRGEYADQFQTLGGAGMGARRLQDYTAFLSNLDRNIVNLQRHIQQLREHFERQRRTWVMSRARTQALEEVVQRYRVQQRHLEDRHEQIEADERALRRHRGHD